MQFRGGVTSRGDAEPTAYVAADPAAEAALEQALQSAGGAFTCQADPGNSWNVNKPKNFNVVGSAGATIATIHLKSSKEPVTVTLPDGRHAFVLTKSGEYANGITILNATLAGKPVKTKPVLSCTAMCEGQLGAPTEIRGAQGEGILSFESPKLPWVFPFLLVTACLGAFCVDCMAGNPKFLLTKNYVQVGHIDKSKDGWTIVAANQDARILKEAVLLMAYAEYYNAYASDGGGGGAVVVF